MVISGENGINEFKSSKMLFIFLNQQIDFCLSPRTNALRGNKYVLLKAFDKRD